MWTDSVAPVFAPRPQWVLAIVVAAFSATGCSGGSSGSGAPAGSSTTIGASPTTGSTKPVEVKVGVAAWKLAAPIANQVLVTDGAQITVLGGLDATKLSTNAITRVNPTTGASQAAGTLAEAVHDSAGVRVANNILVIGGGGPSESGTADAQRVTPDGHTAIVGRMPQPRSDHVAAAVGGKIYVLGGYDGTNIVADVVTTTDGTSFTRAGTLPVPVRYPAIAVLGNSIYLFGGVVSTKGTDTAAIQRLDTTTGAITVVGQLPTTVSHASAIVLANQVYLLGGYVDNTQLSDQVLHYDPTRGTANGAGRLPEPNSDAAAIVVNHVGYLLGGKSTARDPLTTVVTVALP